MKNLLTLALVLLSIINLQAQSPNLIFNNSPVDGVNSIGSEGPNNEDLKIKGERNVLVTVNEQNKHASGAFQVTSGTSGNNLFKVDEYEFSLPGLFMSENGSTLSTQFMDIDIDYCFFYGSTEFYSSSSFYGYTFFHDQIVQFDKGLSIGYTNNKKSQISMLEKQMVIENLSEDGDIILQTKNNVGNVGIGTTTPATKLEVNGNINVGVDNSDISTGNNTYGNKISFLGANSSTDAIWMSRYNVAYNASELRINIGDDLSDDDKFVIGSTYYGDGLFKPVMTVLTNGNIGIGVSDPKNKLSVNGPIWATEVKVSLTDAADWVFEEDYDLKPLSELKKFVLKNKHLPEIPSAEEFRREDLKVSEMTNKLLQKIEELTLYTIKQEEKLEAQGKELERMNQLEERLLQLEKILIKM
ncbi:hypothetical protein ACXGQW_04660 [Wenyingzhuangia sp. IMCC45533]